MKNYKIKRLSKAYTKRFTTINKNFFTDNSVGLTLFVDYLMYIRDLTVVTAKEDINKNVMVKTKIATLTAAIAEFNAYKNTLEPQTKAFHWANFCEIIKLNMEEWLAFNDSI